MKAPGRPTFSTADACRLTREHWNLTGTARPLPSERDQNFQISTGDAGEFLLKISNSHEDPGVLDFQDQAMTHLARDRDALFSGIIVCPQIQPTREGKRFLSVDGANSQPHSVRLLNYLPGTPLAHATPHSQALLISLGRLMGGVDRSLQRFTHPHTNEGLQWDMKHAGRVVGRHLGSVSTSPRRRLVERFLKGFEQTVEPQFQHLRTTFIHNDANDLNVLVREGADGPCVRGIIDFGDMVRTHTVFEPAITAAYALLRKPNPLEAAVMVVKGYATRFDLTELETFLLFDLICTRLITSVVLAAHQRALEPDNDYLSVSEKDAWQALELLSAIEPAYARERLRLASLQHGSDDPPT